MNNNENVGHSYKPTRFLKGNKDVISNSVTKNIVTNKGNGEVAQGDDDVGDDDTLPHRSLRRLLRGGRDGCLNFEHNIVACVCESHIAESIEEPECLPYVAVVPTCVGNMWLYTLA